MLKSTMLQDPAVSREQLREQIRETVREAQAAAKQAAEEARQASQDPKAQGGPVIVVPPVPPMPGQTVIQRFPDEQIPPQAENIAIAFFIMMAAIIIGLPIMRAIGRRIERGAPPPAVPKEVQEQLQHLAQSVDAIAIEVERISEGQRFTTKMLSERVREPSKLGDGT
jgi:N-dimethylarginine dimethylaminohydrolase